MSIISSHLATMNSNGNTPDGQDWRQLEGIISGLGLRTRRIDHERVLHFATDGSAIVECEAAWDVEGREEFGWEGVDGVATDEDLARRAEER